MAVSVAFQRESRVPTEGFLAIMNVKWVLNCLVVAAGRRAPAGLEVEVNVGGGGDGGRFRRQKNENENEDGEIEHHLGWKMR